MPRPTPDYIPEELVKKAAALGFTPKTYAEHLGFRPNRFYGFFGKPHSKLKPYLLICRAAEINLDELAQILKESKFEKFIEDLQVKTGISGVGLLARSIGVSDGFIYQRIKNPGVNGLGSYIEMSEALGWSLDTLAGLCIH